MARATQPHPRVASLDRIERVSFAERAYEAIRESILQGRFQPGEQLVEARLAADLDVSRGPVREALKRLRDEGLVVNCLHRGSYVRIFTVDDIVNLYNVRIGLESVAIRLATRERRSTALLCETIEAMAAAGRSGDLFALSAHELAFHEVLVQMSGNEYVIALFKSIAAQVRIAISLDNAEFTDPVDVAREHEPLVDAIEGGDEEVASTLLGEHIGSSLAPTLSRLAGRESAERAAARLLVPLEFPPRREG
jgi:DNA-binding GntR family transcriptional regulator